jgi:hypothetical protein
MKRNLISILLLSLALAGYSQRFDGEKSRTIEKQYSTDKSETLAVSNSFGKVQVETWDRNEIAVKVELIGRGSSEREAQKVLDNLEVEINQSASSISFKTVVNSRLKGNNDEGFEVNYTVKLPSDNPIDISNKFGDVFIDDRTGTVKADVAYGALKTERLEGQADVEVSFGSGYLEYLADAELEIKYSNVEIDEAKSIRIEEGFSDLKIENVAKLDLQAKYGSVDIASVGEIQVDIRFSQFQIEKLTKSIEMYGAYVTDFEIEEITSSVELVDLETKFGSSELAFTDDFYAIIDADLKFSDLSYRDLDLKFSRQITSGNSKEYYGVLGPDEDTKRLVKIESSYGNYKLRLK